MNNSSVLHKWESRYKTQFLHILSLKVKDARYTEKLNNNFQSCYE